MLFVKSAKIFAASMALGPLTGCAVATGAVFGNFLSASASAPDERSQLFSTCLLAFALIETFCFFALGLAGFAIFVF